MFVLSYIFCAPIEAFAYFTFDVCNRMKTGAINVPHFGPRDRTRIIMNASECFSHGMHGLLMMIGNL